MKSILIILLSSLSLVGTFHKNLFCQNLPAGAEAAGLGFATVSLTGKMAVWGNAAGLADVRKQQCVVGYENRYGLSQGLHTIQAAYLHPFKSTTAGLSFYRFGDELYSQHKLSLLAGHQVGQFSGGIRLNQHQYSIEGGDTRFALAIDAGVIAKLLSQLELGMQITNISQAGVSKQTAERIPTNLSIGLCYKPDTRLKLLAELSYELERSPFVKVGLEYLPLEFIAFRSGINTGQEAQLFLGLGLRHNIVHFDYALETHQVLGISQHFGLAYLIP